MTHLLPPFVAQSEVINLYAADSPFPVRMATLMSAWRNVTTLLSSSTPEACDNVMHLILRHTLHTMLMGQWPTGTAAHRAYIRHHIETCLPLVQCSPKSVHRCRYILEHLERPWDHPVLQRLMGLRPANAAAAERKCSRCAPAVQRN